MSNRKTIIAAIARLGTATLADLEEACSTMGRDKIRFTLGDVKKNNLVRLLKDDITNQPAYRLSPAGEKWLAEQNKGSEHHPKPVEGKITGSQPSALLASPVFTEGLAVAPAAEHSAPAADEIRQLREQLRLAEQQRDDHFNAREGMQLDLTRMEKRVEDLQDEIDRRGATILALEKRIAAQDAEIQYRAGVISDLSQKINSNERPPAIQEADSYIVHNPGKPVRFYKKPENAKAAALRSIASHSSAAVFALVPLGKAVRGAQWKDAACV